MLRVLTAAETSSIEGIVKYAVDGIMALISKVRGREVVYDVLTVSNSVVNIQQSQINYNNMTLTRRRR